MKKSDYVEESICKIERVCASGDSMEVGVKVLSENTGYDDNFQNASEDLK